MNNSFLHILCKVVFSFFAYNEECLCICRFFLRVKTMFPMFCKVVKARRFFMFFFNVTCIKILTHIFPHLYFLCISYVLQVYHCLFQKTTTSIFLLHSSSSRELYQWHWLPRGSVFRRLLCSLWTRHVHMWGARNRWYVSKYIILAYNKSHSRNISGIESWANCIYILSIIWCSSI